MPSSACRRPLRDVLSFPTRRSSDLPLTPGEPTRFQIELWPVHLAFLPGHRVRVSVTSSDFPWFARSMNQFGPLKGQAEPLVAINTVRSEERRVGKECIHGSCDSQGD